MKDTPRRVRLEMALPEDTLCVTCHLPLEACEGHDAERETTGLVLPPSLDMQEHTALFEANRARLQGLGARGFAFNMQNELLEELITEVFGPVGTPKRNAWMLTWERKVSERLDVAEANAASIEAQRFAAQLQQQQADAAKWGNGKGRR